MENFATTQVGYFLGHHTRCLTTEIAARLIASVSGDVRYMENFVVKSLTHHSSASRSHDSPEMRRTSCGLGTKIINVCEIGGKIILCSGSWILSRTSSPSYRANSQISDAIKGSASPKSTMRMKHGGGSLQKMEKMAIEVKWGLEADSP